MLFCSQSPDHLQKFLPPMVVEILKEKKEQEVLNNLMDWLKESEDELLGGMGATPGRCNLDKAMAEPSHWQKIESDRVREASGLQ